MHSPLVISVSELLTFHLPHTDPFQLPFNLVRSNQRRRLEGVPSTEQERILFSDFITVCRGRSTEHIQCEWDEEKREFRWTLASGCSETLQKWMQTCTKMGSDLFELVNLLRGGLGGGFVNFKNSPTL